MLSRRSLGGVGTIKHATSVLPWLFTFALAFLAKNASTDNLYHVIFSA